MPLRDNARLRVAALALAALSLTGVTACVEGNGEDQEGGQVQEENGEGEE